MTFLPALPGQGRSRGVWARVYSYPTGRYGDRRRLTFTLSRECMDQLKWQGGERIVVMIGVGEDVGSFRLVRCGKPRMGLRISANSNAAGFRVMFTAPEVIHGVRVADFLDRFQGGVAPDIQIEGGVITLRCPAPVAAEWARATCSRACSSSPRSQQPSSPPAPPTPPAPSSDITKGAAP